MASRLLHLAIAGELMKERRFTDPNRFMIGSILPDACADPNEKTANHYKISICGGKKRTYDITGFRQEFGDRMPHDELYLGYYLHLIQDIIYRSYFYPRSAYDPKDPENVRLLHGDYAQINTYVICKYGIVHCPHIPDDFENEPIQKQFGFDLDGFLQQLAHDFDLCPPSPLNFITEEMTDEYVNIAVSACNKEMDAVSKGLPLMNETEYAWDK